MQLYGIPWKLKDLKDTPVGLGTGLLSFSFRSQRVDLQPNVWWRYEKKSKFMSTYSGSLDSIAWSMYSYSVKLHDANFQKIFPKFVD